MQIRHRLYRKGGVGKWSVYLIISTVVALAVHGNEGGIEFGNISVGLLFVR